MPQHVNEFMALRNIKELFPASELFWIGHLERNDFGRFWYFWARDVWRELEYLACTRRFVR
jgi:hypothetical protein